MKWKPDKDEEWNFRFFKRLAIIVCAVPIAVFMDLWILTRNPWIAAFYFMAVIAFYLVLTMFYRSDDRTRQIPKEE